MDKNEFDYETLIELIELLPRVSDVLVIHHILIVVQHMKLHGNHDRILSALEKSSDSLPKGLTRYFESTLAHVRAQKEAAEKIVKYEGLLNHTELRIIYSIALNAFMFPGSSAKISIDPLDEKSELFRLTISLTKSDIYLDDDFSPTGVLSTWSEKFTRIPALPKEKTEKTNSVTLPSGDVLSFRDGRWWITRSRGGSIEEVLLGEAHNLLRQNCLVNAVTNEAWVDISKPDQPILS